VVQSLGIRVDSDEFNALDSGVDHPVYSRPAGSSDTYHLYPCECLD
jgi:hypothetical protein